MTGSECTITYADNDGLEEVSVITPINPTRLPLSMIAHALLDMVRAQAVPPFVDWSAEHVEIVQYLEHMIHNPTKGEVGHGQCLVWRLRMKIQGNVEVQLETAGSKRNQSRRWLYQPLSGVMGSRVFHSDPEQQEKGLLVEYLQAMPGVTVDQANTAANYIYGYMPESNPEMNLYWFLTLSHLYNKAGVHVAFFYQRAYPKPEWVDKQGLHHFSITPAGFVKGQSRITGPLTRAQILGLDLPR